MKKRHFIVVVVDVELNTFPNAAQGCPLHPKTTDLFHGGMKLSSIFEIKRRRQKISLMLDYRDDR